MLLVVTGSPVSCVRAFVMWIGYACARVIHRDYDLWTWLAVSGLVVVAWRPEALFEASFQLSTASVAAIALAGGRREKAKGGRGERLVSWVRAGLRVSAAATAGTLPLVWWHFGTIPVLSLAANLLAVPLVTLAVMPCAFVGVVTWEWGGWLGELAAGCTEELLFVLHAVLEAWVAVVPAQSPAWGGWWVAGLIGAGGLLLAGKRRWMGVGVLAAGLAGYALPSGGDGVEVHVLPVGEGDATLVRLPCGEVWMIDGGPGRSGRFTVLPFLRHRGWTSLDGFILTHGHEDHWGGIHEVASQVEVGRILHGPTDSARGVAALLGRRWPKARSVEVAAGDGWARCGVRFDVVWPPEEGNPGRSENDTSLMLRLEYAGVELVWAGDVEGRQELEAAEAVAALRRGRLPVLSIVKAPHHGHRSKMAGVLNGMLAPDVVVLSAEGERTWYGGLWLAGAGRGGAWVHVTGVDGPFFLAFQPP